ncbi:MAG: hypothetical protein JW954_08155 [Dehalococcoidaceae bacterium]|nr:hypothetical protein [Dehalococcoidaceae bacterium]
MKKLSLIIVALVLAIGLGPAVLAGAQPSPVEYIETLYISNTLLPSDGYTQLYEVVLDDATPKADLIPLPDVGYGEGLIPMEHADAIACTPDGTRIYATQDNGLVGYYDLTVPEWNTLGTYLIDGTTSFGATDQAAFAGDGALYVTRNSDDSIYSVGVDAGPDFLVATFAGRITNGATAAVVDVYGADIVFDENDDCYMWTINSRTGAPAGLYKFAIPETPGDIAADFLGTGSQGFTGLAIRGGGAVAYPLLGSRTDTDSISIINETDGTLGTQYPMYLGGSPFNGYIYGDMTVGELAVPNEEFYSICGYKLADWNDELIPMPGWEIFLEIWNGDSFEPYGSTYTDEFGKYCFTDLPAGEYKVSEIGKTGWDQVTPEDSYIIDLPQTIVYGIERYTGDVYGVDVLTGASWLEFAMPTPPGANSASPNGLAYNPLNGFFYYTDYQLGTTPDKLYFWDGSSQYLAGQVAAGTIACGDMYNGKYYYIPSGTDDLYEIAFDSDGFIASDEKLADISNGVHRWTFDGDIAVNDGVVYGWGKCGVSGHGFEYFTYDLDSGDFSFIKPSYQQSLQLAFGSDGTLFGHRAGTGGYFYAIDTTDASVTLVEPLPEPALQYTDCASGQSRYNFVNTPHLFCFDETAWAADGEAGTTRFVESPGNWATYIDYNLGDGSYGEPVEFPLYAGQTYYAGKLLVWDDGTYIYVQYIASDADGYAPEGYCGGTWTGLSEYHLQVVDEFVDFNDYRAYNKKKDEYGAPIPGSFDTIWEGDKVTITDEIVVDISALIDEENTDLYIAAHAVMWWCGYDCDVLAEIEAALGG